MQTPADNDYKEIYKLVVIGDISVGKTCLIKSYLKEPYEAIPTVTIDFTSKLTMLNNGRKIKLFIWDTSGQERYADLSQIHYRRAAGAVIVYDITNRQSFENVKYWYQQFMDIADKYSKVIIVGNKADSNEQRQVAIEEGEKLAIELRSQFYEVSA